LHLPGEQPVRIEAWIVVLGGMGQVAEPRRGVRRDVDVLADEVVGRAAPIGPVKYSTTVPKMSENDSLEAPDSPA
jgi:hypothetical protein